MNSSNQAKNDPLSLLGITRWQNRHQITEEASSNEEKVINKKLIILSSPALSFNDEQGEMLTKMLKAIDLEPEDVILSSPEESTITHHVQQTTARILLVFGEECAQTLLETRESLNQLREKRHRFGTEQLALVPSYHPQHLASHPADKRATYQDLLFIKSLLATTPTA